jgi:hypothetical protein
VQWTQKWNPLEDVFRELFRQHLEG